MQNNKKKKFIYLLFPFLICGSVGTIILAIIMDVVLQGNISNSRYEQTYNDMVKNTVLYENMQNYMGAEESMKQLGEYSGNNVYKDYFFLVDGTTVMIGNDSLPEGTDISKVSETENKKWNLLKKEKNTYYFCLVSVKDTEWALGIFCPTEVLMQEYHSAENIIISVALLIFAISFLLCFLLAMIPMKNMIDQNKSLTAQNYDNSRKLAEEYIEKILHGKSKIRDEAKYLTEMSLPVDFQKSFFLTLFVLDWKWDVEDRREEIWETINWLNVEICEFIDNFGIWLNDENVFAYCLQSQEKTSWNDMHADLMILQKNYIKKYGKSISVIVQRDPVYAEDMRDVFEKELKVIPYRLFRGFNCFLTVEDIHEENDRLPDLMEIQNQINEWTKEICSGREDIGDKYLQLLESLEGNWETYHTVLLMMKTSFEQGDLIIGGNAEQDYRLKELLNFEDCLKKEEIEEKIVQTIECLVRQKKDMSLNRQYEYVEKINHYIEQRYDDVDFGILQIAEEIGVSASYLSKIYKQITNINIVDRVTDKRMEAAARLLEEGETTTNAVYAKVGYASNNYFYRVFKKYYGVTPRLYREMDSEGRGNLITRKKIVENERS